MGPSCSAALECVWPRLTARPRRLHRGSRHIEYAYRSAASGIGEGFKGRSLRVKRLEFFRTTAIALECFEGALRFRIRFPPAAGEIPCAFLGDESRHIGWRVAKNEPYLVWECRFALRGFEFFSRKCGFCSALANVIRAMVMVVARGAARNESFGFGRGRGFAIRLNARCARCIGSLDAALDFRYDAFGRKVFETALRKQLAGVPIVQSVLDELGAEYQKQNASGSVCKGFYAKMKPGKP